MNWFDIIKAPTSPQDLRTEGMVARGTKELDDYALAENVDNYIDGESGIDEMIVNAAKSGAMEFTIPRHPIVAMGGKFKLSDKAAKELIQEHYLKVGQFTFKDKGSSGLLINWEEIKDPMEIDDLLQAGTPDPTQPNPNQDLDFNI